MVGGGESARSPARARAASVALARGDARTRGRRPAAAPRARRRRRAGATTSRASRPTSAWWWRSGSSCRSAIRELPRLGYLVNAHASLLPRHRGAAPIAHAILAGDAETGISIMRSSARWTRARSASRSARAIRPDETRGELEERLAALAAEAVAEALDAIAAGRARFTPQDDDARDASRRSSAPRTPRSTSRSRPSASRGACARSRRGRAPPPRSAASGFASSARARSRAPATGRPAWSSATATQLRVATADGWLALERVQRPGGRVLALADFLRGCDVPDGARARARRRRERCRGGLSDARRARPPLGLAARRRGAPTQARLVAARVLERVERARAFADLALQGALGRATLGARDRAFATELVYGTLRWRGRLDFLLATAARPPARRPRARACARCSGSAPTRSCSATRVPAAAAVDQTVRSARALGAERASGFVNAVLRRLAQQAATLPLPALDADPLAHLEHALGLPRWIAERWLAAFGPAEAALLAEASNAVPPLTARANRAAHHARRPARGAPPALPGSARLSLRSRRRRARSRRTARRVDPAFVAGLLHRAGRGVAARRRAARSAAGRARARRLRRARHQDDARSQSASVPTGVVVALDSSERRLALVGRAARRLGLENVTALACDASLSLADLPGVPFDRVAGRRAVLGARRAAPQPRCALARHARGLAAPRSDAVGAPRRAPPPS